MKALSNHLSESLLNKARSNPILSTKLKTIEILNKLIKMEPEIKFLAPKTNMTKIIELGKKIEVAYADASLPILKALTILFDEQHLNNIDINYDIILLHELITSGMFSDITKFLKSHKLSYEFKVSRFNITGFKLKTQLTDSQSEELDDICGEYDLLLAYDGTERRTPMIGWDASSWDKYKPTIEEIL